MQQLVDGLRVGFRRHQTGLDHGLRFRRKDKTLVRFRIIKRLDAERVAGQHQAVAVGVINSDGIHAAQVVGEFHAVSQIEVQRRFAVGLGGRRRFDHHVAEFDVIVDFAVGNQGRFRRRAVPGQEGLIAGLQVDNGQPRMDQTGAARHMHPLPVRPPVDQRLHQAAQGVAVGRRTVGRHDAGDATH